MKSNRYRIVWIVTALVLALCVSIIAVFAVNESLFLQPISAEECFALTESAMLYVRIYDANDKLVTTGSGFIVSPDGKAVTAAHVVKKAERVTVIRPDDTELNASVIYYDYDTDIAMLALEVGEYPYLTVCEKRPARGAVVRAIGYPIKGTPMITEGICAAPYGEYSYKEHMFVTCAFANGMSGGPILDEYGRVVGLVSGTLATMTGINVSALTDKLAAVVKENNGSVYCEISTDESTIGSMPKQKIYEMITEN